MKRISLVLVAAFLAVGAGPALAADSGSSLTDSKTLSPQPPLVNEQLVTATLAPNGLPSLQARQPDRRNKLADRKRHRNDLNH